MTKNNSTNQAVSFADKMPRIVRWGFHLSRLLFLVGGILLALVFWLSRTWAELSPDEILFHLRASLSGTDTTVVWAFCLRYLPLVLAGLAVDIWLMVKARARGVRAAVFAIITTAVLSLGMTGMALVKFDKMIDLRLFLGGNGEDFIAKHYVNPADVEVVFPEKKRNLIYIYLESMELTFADEANGGVWEENLIPELCDLAHEGETFAGTSDKLNGALVLPGCTWTMGGLFAQSSGVPLKLPTLGGNSREALEGFFPELVCLGDILNNEGYQQYVLFGSNADFGNRRTYYLEHKDFNVYDYPRALEEGFIPKGYKVWWGFEDEKLFEKAQQMLTEAASQGEPFNLTMLTADTHFEDGYVCRLCKEEHGDNQYANVMSCSSRQVAEFVRWIQDQDFYKDTTIIINGDHTTMDKDFCNDVAESYPRRTYTCIINGVGEAADPAQRREYATVDLFPTTLAALGCTFAGDRLGVGTNLYAATPTIVEELGFDECSLGFARRSEFLNSYANALEGEELVDAVLAAHPQELKYEVARNGDDTGFVLYHIAAFSKEVVESARLVVTDTRTGKQQVLPMYHWKKQKNWGMKFLLLGRITIPEEELQYYKADAYVTIVGAKERLFASWSGAATEG